MLIAADIGSSFVKLAVIGNDGQTVKTEKFRTLRIDTNKSYEYEYDMDNAVKKIKSFVISCKENYDIKRIILSTQMHGFLLKINGAMTNYISWQDERSLQPDESGISMVDRLKAKIPADIIHRGGINIKSELSFCGMMTCLKDISIESCVFYTLGSYIIECLTGKNITHETNAAPTGLFDIYLRNWNYELIELLGFGNVVFPEVKSDISVCGSFMGIPVYPDIGDQQATILGSDITENTLILNIGTASQMIMICNAVKLNSMEKCEIRPFFNGKYIRVVSKLPGGRSMQVIIDFFHNIIKTFTGIELSSEEIWNMVNAFENSDKTDLTVKLGFFRVLMFNEGYISNIDYQNLTAESIIKAAYKDIAETFIKMMIEYDINSVDEICILGKFSEAVINELSERSEVMGKRLSCNINVESVFKGLTKLVENVIV